MLWIPRADLDCTLYVQNPVGSGEAALVVDFYDPSGVLVHYEATSIPPYGSLALELDSLAGLPSGYEGGAVLESDQPIRAVVNIEPAGTGIFLSYGAVETVDTTVVVPTVSREYYGYNSSL